MRLICPNCDAQYEVDASLIPESGRDVQCADCGHVWFQVPETAILPEEEDEADTAALLGRIVAPMPEPAAAPDPEPEPGPSPQPVAPAEPDPPALPRASLDDALLAVLRDEADREIRARAEETARAGSRGIETQPDLGLDDPPSLRIRPRAAPGVDPYATPADDTSAAGTPVAATAPAQPVPQRPARRELLPDIDRINSTLDASGARRKDAGVPGMATAPTPQRTGFRRGFLAVLAVAALAWGAYVQAERLRTALPQAAPLIEGYVAAVNGARLGLDRLVRDLLGTVNG